MSMMFTGWMMVLGIAVIVVIGIFVIAAVSRVAGDRLGHEPLYDGAEKPKRDHLILSDDGELLEMADSVWEADEKPKRGDKAQETSSPPVAWETKASDFRKGNDQ